MNRNFRTVSALLRHDWLIEESYAQAHEQLINAYLSGKYPQAEEQANEAAAGNPAPKGVFAVAATTNLRQLSQAQRYALDDPAMPENSVLIVEVKGAMFKDDICGSLGSMSYARLLNQSYQNDKIIGQVIVVDTPGGQVYGTSTLHDAVSNPAKPTVTLIDEGIMASAGVWAFCGSDYIMASQKTCMIGSIGVFVRLRDSSKADEQYGYKTISVYSRLSPQKNKSVNDALAGDTTALEDELDLTAGLFHEAVRSGRGDKLKSVKKGSADDYLEGGMYSAGKGIELGLIDGYGTLDTAVAKVLELHNARTEKSTSSAQSQSRQPIDYQSSTLDSQPHTEAADPSAETELTIDADEVSPATADSNSNSSPNTMFGFVKLAALSAIQGVAAADITTEQIDAINAELAAAGYHVAAISQAQFAEAQTLQGQVTAANTKVSVLEKEVERLGQQPGHLGSKSQKTEEKTAGDSADEVISETDAELRRLKALQQN